MQGVTCLVHPACGRNSKPFGCVRPAVCKGRQRALGTHVCAATGSDNKIENLSETYCDDFVCTSSPQVEQSIRAFAKDVERCRNWTLGIFAEDVRYRDGVRSFTGKENYRTCTFNADRLESYTTAITGMKMADKSNAVVTWTFKGTLGPLPVSGRVESCLALNVLTGRITEHTDKVGLTCSPPAAVVYTLRKFAWAQRENAANVQRKVDNMLDSLSMDPDDGFKQDDPSDPTRFFQQKDNTFNDAVSYAIFLTILWTLWQAYQNLDGF